MVLKEARHKLETEVHNLRHEAGIRAVWNLLHDMRDELNRKWPDAIGEDVARLQGEAKRVALLIKVIEHGPTIKLHGGGQ